MAYNFPQSSSAHSAAAITPAVLDLLPSTQTCMRILSRARLVLNQRPVPLPGGWRGFESKALKLLNRRPGSAYSGNGQDSGYVSDGESDEGSSSSTKERRRSEDSLTFFAILCAIMAIGASVSSPDVFGSESVDAGFLYALSQQALSVWETSSSSTKRPEKEKILFLVACLAGVGYLLLVTPDQSDESEEDQGSTGGKARAVFPVVGKMVNFAREMGLGKEKAAWPEDGSEGNSGHDVVKQRHLAWDDVRRMVWWDIMFYDLFTSDSLSHPSLISPLSYSIKLPELSDTVFDQGSKRYILARNRLVQLAHRVKHRLSHPDCCCGYTFDQAITLEDDVRKWSREFLSQDEEEDERRHNWELSLTAQLLVLRAYVPFLTSATSAASAKKQANGVPGPNKTSGKTASPDKPQIQGSVLAMATQSCLGAAQTILRLGNKLHVSLSKEHGNSLSMPGPVLMDFYALERLVLDAVVITQSSTAVSVVSEAEVRRGLEILLEKEFALGRERKEIWETIKRRVSSTNKPQTPSQGPQLKRKIDQVEIQGALNVSETVESKNVETTQKHAKTSRETPVIGVRFRQGRMLSSGPVHAVDGRYGREREGSRSFGSVSRVQGDKVNSGGQAMIQVDTSVQMQHQLSPHQTQQHMGPFVNSPTTYSPEHQSLQGQPQLRMPPERSVTRHQSQTSQPRASFDHSQPKSMYRFEESTAPSPVSALVDAYHNSVNGVAPSQNSSSSSPYQSTSPPTNGPQFCSSNPPSVGFGGPDSQTMAGYVSNHPPKFGHDARPAPPFENPRPAFSTENPQPQAFEKLQSCPTFGQPVVDDGQSPPLHGSPESMDSHSHDSSSTAYSMAHSDTSHSSLSASSYFHPSVASTNGYDPSAMQPLGMRIDNSVPGTPIYEKPPHHMMYAHAQHSMLSDTFVGEPPPSQGLPMNGGPHPSHHTPHQPWASAQQPPPLGVGAGQAFWC